MTNAEAFDKLSHICKEQLDKLPEADEKYRERLTLELKEVNSQNEGEYFLNLTDKKFENENNLLIPYLLGICETFDISKPPKYEYGDYPDVDVDFVPVVRNYLKEKYSREQFGEDYVCNIATYTTFGLRSALIDMAKVFDLDRKEILNLTTRLGIKDDEGEILTLDKAIEIYDDLRKYLEEHPDMADAARRILHRNRNMGMHASGLIISGVPIKSFVPLVKVKDGAVACSSWVEGLHGTDLGAVGLVKFDFLSLDGNLKIAKATKMVQEGITTVKNAQNIIGSKVSALPGKSSWSDISYINDEKALQMANRGDLKMIFQYDGSEGIRRLAKQGGVTSFDDLVAYASIFRPGPMKANIHETYCRRKKGQEKYDSHSLIDGFMASTYYCIIYQEQVLRILNVVGNIPLKDCEAVRKAISKKKADKFKKYKEIFIANGQKTLGYTEKKVEDIWNQIEFFSQYGFNLAHGVAYTYISSRMLYLKCHHPLAFYTSVLDCMKTTGPKDYRKLKDYKQEAIKHGINVNRIDINKSKATVSAIDGEVYWGFSKIKGVGDDVAMRIEKMQPYTDYEDFLKRFGPDAKPNQAVIALRLFPGDPVTLYQFYETYKNQEKKCSERKKRLDSTIGNHKETIKSLCPGNETISRLAENINQGNYEVIRSMVGCEHHKMLDHVWKRICTATANYGKKENALPSLANFQASQCPSCIDDEYRILLEDKDAAEEAYYGFVWDHPLEKCRLYNYHTFEQFEAEDNAIGPIDVMVRQVKQMQGPKTTYYRADVEDSTTKSARVTIWPDDYSRFEHLLKKGNCVRMTVKAPTKGYDTYTLNSLGRWRKPPKETDMRILLLN